MLSYFPTLPSRSSISCHLTRHAPLLATSVFQLRGSLRACGPSSYAELVSNYSDLRCVWTRVDSFRIWLLIRFFKPAIADGASSWYPGTHQRAHRSWIDPTRNGQKAEEKQHCISLGILQGDMADSPLVHSLALAMTSKPPGVFYLALWARLLGDPLGCFCVSIDGQKYTRQLKPRIDAPGPLKDRGQPL